MSCDKPFNGENVQNVNKYCLQEIIKSKHPGIWGLKDDAKLP